MLKFKSFFDSKQFKHIEENTWGLLEESKKTNDHLSTMVSLKRRYLEKIKNTAARQYWEEHFDKPPVKCVSIFVNFLRLRRLYRWSDVTLSIRQSVKGKYADTLLTAHFSSVVEEMRSGLDDDGSGDITVLEYHAYTAEHDLLTRFDMLWKKAEKVRTSKW